MFVYMNVLYDEMAGGETPEDRVACLESYRGIEVSTDLDTKRFRSEDPVADYRAACDHIRNDLREKSFTHGSSLDYFKYDTGLDLRGSRV